MVVAVDVMGHSTAPGVFGYGVQPGRPLPQSPLLRFRLVRPLCELFGLNDLDGSQKCAYK